MQVQSRDLYLYLSSDILFRVYLRYRQKKNQEAHKIPSVYNPSEKCYSCEQECSAAGTTPLENLFISSQSSGIMGNESVILSVLHEDSYGIVLLAGSTLFNSVQDYSVMITLVLLGPVCRLAKKGWNYINHHFLWPKTWSRLKSFPVLGIRMRHVLKIHPTILQSISLIVCVHYFNLALLLAYGFGILITHSNNCFSPLNHFLLH